MTTRLERNKRRNHSKRNSVSLERARLETLVYKDELENGLLLVDKIQKERARMVKEVELELSYQGVLKEKITYLKEQVNELRQSHTANSKVLDSIKAHRSNMQQEVVELESNILTNKAVSTAKNVTDNYAKLMEAVNSDRMNHPKEKSILLSILRDLIQTTHENEFEGYSWKAKVAHSGSSVGARIRFSNLAIHESNLKGIYQPVIKGFETKFSTQDISIDAQTKKESGVVSTLDIIVKISYQVRGQFAELP